MRLYSFRLHRETSRRKKLIYFEVNLASNKLYIDALRFSSQRLFVVVVLIVISRVPMLLLLFHLIHHTQHIYFTYDTIRFYYLFSFIHYRLNVSSAPLLCMHCKYKNTRYDAMCLQKAANGAHSTNAGVSR